MARSYRTRADRESLIVTAIECSECSGTGQEWRRKANGEIDRRYKKPLGQCPACKGTGRR